MKHLFTRAPAVFTGAAALLAGGLMAAPASAQGEAESMMVLGGYTNYTVSLTKHPDGQLAEQDGYVSIHNNTEIFFNGSGETDGGLQVSARVELEGHTVDDQIDEHYITVSGGFGSLEVGANDSADERTAVGIHYNSTAVDYWYTNVDATPTNAGYRGLGQNDGMGIVYTSPSLGGATFAIGYKPSAEGDDKASNQSGDDNLVSIGVIYDGDMDGITFKGSLGYHTHKIQAMDATPPDPEVMADGTVDWDLDDITAAKPKTDVAVWGVGVELGFGDTTLYARHQDDEREPEGEGTTELKISSLAVSHVIGPINLGLGWVRSTQTAPVNGLRPDATEAAEVEREREDTMVIGSVDYSLGSGVTLGGYLAWGETEQKGGVQTVDATDGPTGSTGPAKDRANTKSGSAFGVALGLAF